MANFSLLKYFFGKILVWFYFCRYDHVKKNILYLFVGKSISLIQFLWLKRCSQKIFTRQNFPIYSKKSDLLQQKDICCRVTGEPLFLPLMPRLQATGTERCSYSGHSQAEPIASQVNKWYITCLRVENYVEVICVEEVTKEEKCSCNDESTLAKKYSNAPEIPLLHLLVSFEFQCTCSVFGSSPELYKQ